MPKEQLPKIERTPVDDLRAMLPDPILSSENLNWNKIQFIQHHQPAASIPEHQPTQHGICINAGKPVQLEQRVDGRFEVSDSAPGDIGVYPAYLSQSFAWNGDAEFCLMYLEPTLLTQLGYELYGSDRIELIPQLTSFFDPLIQQIAFALKTILETDGIGSRLYSDSMANALAVHLLTRYSSHDRATKPNAGKLSQSQFTQILDYIQSHLDQTLSLADLAAVLQLSEYHFARLFKQTTRVSPHQYLIQCRVDRAKQLLLQGELSIAEIAQLVGFSSQGHLTYHFKRQVGVTPKTYTARI